MAHYESETEEGYAEEEEQDNEHDEDYEDAPDLVDCSEDEDPPKVSHSQAFIAECEEAGVDNDEWMELTVVTAYLAQGKDLRDPKVAQACATAAQTELLAFIVAKETISRE